MVNSSLGKEWMRRNERNAQGTGRRNSYGLTFRTLDSGRQSPDRAGLSENLCPVTGGPGAGTLGFSLPPSYLCSTRQAKQIYVPVLAGGHPCHSPKPTTTNGSQPPGGRKWGDTDGCGGLGLLGGVMYHVQV